VVLQATITDCGPACLGMVLAAHGMGVSLAALRDDLGAGRDGVTALDLRDGAQRHGLRCRALRVRAEQLHRLPMPLVAYWEGNHFVVVEKVRRASVDVVDPALGRRRLGSEQFAAGFSGVALTLTPKHPAAAGTRRIRPTAPAWRTVLLPVLRGSPGVPTALLATSALLLLAGLAVPAGTAWIVDRVVAGGGRQGTVTGWSPFAAVAALGAAVGVLTLLRGIAAAAMQQRVGRQLTGGLVDRLLSAPLTFIEHRGSGEVVSRLTATDAVRDALATQLIGAALDTVVALSYLIIVLDADPELGLVTAALGIT